MKKTTKVSTSRTKNKPSTATKTKPVQSDGFALGKENYMYIAIGFVVIIIGYMLMIGGGAENPNEFSEEIFSFRRITLAPIVILIGFVSIIWAIMKKPKEE